MNGTGRTTYPYSYDTMSRLTGVTTWAIGAQRGGSTDVDYLWEHVTASSALSLTVTSFSGYCGHPFDIAIAPGRQSIR